MIRNFWLTLLFGLLTATLITIVAWTADSSKYYLDFVMGQEYEHSYSVPDASCERKPLCNTTINCLTLYRSPVAIQETECRLLDGYHWEDITYVTCQVRHLESRVHLLIGTTRNIYDYFAEYRYPGLDHNVTNFGIWPFNQRLRDSFIYSISSEGVCNKNENITSVNEVNECILKFVTTPLILSGRYYWGPYISMSPSDSGDQKSPLAPYQTLIMIPSCILGMLSGLFCVCGLWITIIEFRIWLKKCRNFEMVLK